MDESLFMLWFSLLKNISLKNKLLLIDIFGYAENIYNASEIDFENKKFFDKKIISTIISSKNINDVLSYKSTLDKKGIFFLHINDERYPYLLKNIFDPPIVLYYIGRLPNKEDNLVSIVGTRTPTPYGEKVTYNIAKGLAQENIGVVSGMAYGIDSIAHSTTIENGGYTIAVLGCGLDMCYPASNYNLMQKIGKNGLLLSEYGLGVKALSHHFPMRNRIIAGLCPVTIVTEAPNASGAMITANLALSEGREVYTVPADIFRKKCEGNNLLIKDGAGVITCLDDILSIFNYNKEIVGDNIQKSEEDNTANLTDDEKFIASFIDYEGITSEELVYKTGLPIEKVQIQITMLELNDIIKKLPNQKFIKI